MIGYLRGEVIYLYTDYVLLDVHGVGYRVFIANSTRQKLRLHEKAQLFTYTSVREDAIILYGFATQEEYDLFLQLLSVSGIGPKVALGILSSITVEGLCRAIQNKQASILTKLPGIGKKSAERLILELKDKVAFDGGEQELLTIENEADVGDDMVAEAMAALQSLGYTQAEIAPIIRKTAKYKTTEAIIKASLKLLSHM
ncbi:Holliday junction branch migration protein RuvA [uncultured Mitsuokella sp.]|uniref:Holliday junction branch migration protein RuvA n=1 Tax=uncultured Mitsuokella sp. TaxID=453120 RepID=UPI0025DF9312|nr:Holliday junction branch migration protein RuvA [uncultured Mitsuokella sp.]